MLTLRVRRIWCLTLLVASAALSAQEENGDNSHFLSLIFENDVFFQEDGGYTNGVALAYGYGPFDQFEQSNTPDWLLPLVDTLGINKDDHKKRAISYLFGQFMNTPEDISVEELLEEQQPYSGALVGRITFYTLDFKSTNRFALLFGVVGPSSKAEETQKTIHKLTDGDDPKGWDNQLKDEPIFRVEASRSRKYWQHSLTDTLSTEVIGSYHAGLGNLSSDIGYGLTFRFGSRLSDIVHVATDLPGREVNPIAGLSKPHWMFFIECLGRYEANNVFIEGNTFHESHGVELIHEQGSISYGASINFRNWAFTYSRSLNSKSYENQPKSGNFGAINITYKY